MLIIYLVVLYIFLDMSMKFLLGLGIGIYIGTRYDFKPLIIYSETELNNKYKEFKEKLGKFEKR
jgi:hypothetical protein